MKSFIRRLRSLSTATSHPSLPDVIHLPALEETWSVRYRPTASRSVQARVNGSGELIVSGRVGDRVQTIKGLRRWLTRQARESLVPWLNELSTSAELPYKRVSVRGQKTRWASCSTKGNINLNYKLLFLQPDVVRYILNHELCHTIHLNHSRRFWSTLADLEPDYRVLNRMAKMGMEEVPEWAKDK